MDKDRATGAAKQAGGKIKETAGKVTGDQKMEAEGKAKKIEGKTQNTVGGVKDAAREFAGTKPKWPAFGNGAHTLKLRPC